MTDRGTNPQTWVAQEPASHPPLGPSDWRRVVLRGLPLAVVVFGCLGLLLLVRLIERPLFGLRRPVTPYITQFVCRTAFVLLGMGYRTIGAPMSQPGAVVANQEQWHHAHALVRVLREELENRANFPAIILIAGNKERESLEILNQGLKGLPARIEIYGRDYVYNVDYIAERMKKLVEEYRRA